MTLPPRIRDLMTRIEAGDPVTQSDVDRVAALQALDMAQLGMDFVAEAVERDRQQTDELQKLLGG